MLMLTLCLDSSFVSHRLLGSIVRGRPRSRPSEADSWSTWEVSVCFLENTIWSGSWSTWKLAGAGVLTWLTPTVELSRDTFIIWEDILLIFDILTMIFVVFWYQWLNVDTEVRLSETESPGSQALYSREQPGTNFHEKESPVLRPPSQPRIQWKKPRAWVSPYKCVLSLIPWLCTSPSLHLASSPSPPG